jgi:amino acid transporter
MSLISVIFGRPLASNEQDETKIGPVAGVPAMGLDGLTSSAYGPEAALTILLPLGAAGLAYIGPITLVILALLAILYFSYRQTIAAYPVNGGSYTVAKENLGVWPGLLAAAALMIDYVLNVAVGISAGVAALVSAAPMLHKYTVPLCLAILMVITLLNLRGTGEAGLAFALPTYLFIACMIIVLAWGVLKSFANGGHPQPVVAPPPVPPAVEAVGLWLLLRAFASGCTAMTGVEAVSNGVSAFREPRVRNANRTLTVIVCVLALLLGGVAWLARAYQVGAMPQDVPGYQSILSQLIGAVAGRGWFYYVAIGSILATLCLSANTSFVGFPRLCRTIAQHDFLPRGFAVAGRRLVYSGGILFLAACAGLLLLAFKGVTDRLIPLFAVGAFLAFTLSQAGMVLHWRSTRGEGWKWKVVLNGVGAVATGLVSLIQVVTKFTSGGWIIVAIIPLIILLLQKIHAHYTAFAEDIRFLGQSPITPLHHTVIVPVNGITKATAGALVYATTISDEVIAVYVEVDSTDTARMRAEWEAWDIGVPLEVVPSPYRSILRPLVEYVDNLRMVMPGELVTIVVPEVVPKRWWEHLLHNKTALYIRTAFLFRPNVVVTAVPYLLGHAYRLRDLVDHDEDMDEPMLVTGPGDAGSPLIRSLT